VQDEDHVPPGREPPRFYVEKAKREIPALFTTADRVFFGRQLAVLLEQKRLFHWVTHRAANELIDEARLRKESARLRDGTEVKFFSLPANRYRRRAIKRACDLIERYSTETVAKACGRQAELLFVNALASRGFVVLKEAVRSFKGQEWTDTNHDLDYIVERDNQPWGVEIKNAWDYIEPDLLEIKLRICEKLQVRPLIILRNAPQTYIHRINDHGGYAMIFETHIYPFGYEALAGEIRSSLEMPTDCPRAIPESIPARFETWLADQPQ
jgi:hypothetical protein